MLVCSSSVSHTGKELTPIAIMHAARPQLPPIEDFAAMISSATLPRLPRSAATSVAAVRSDRHCGADCCCSGSGSTPRSSDSPSDDEPPPPLMALDRVRSTVVDDVGPPRGDRSCPAPGR
jgi:hypothetical protein